VEIVNYLKPITLHSVRIIKKTRKRVEMWITFLSVIINEFYAKASSLGI
jgi:hypothetical protein